MITSVQSLPPSAAPKFSGALPNPAALEQGVRLSPWVSKINSIFKPIEATRGRELLFIDIMGFTLTRTLMDFFRPTLFKNQTHDRDKKTNVTAARERLMMELIGALPDAVGLVAFLIGTAFDANRQAFSNTFTPIQTLDLFKDILKNPQVNNPSRFVEELARQIHPAGSGEVLSALKQGISHPQQAEEAATRIAKHLKQSSFDITAGGQHHALDVLMEDAAAFLKTLESPEVLQSWKTQAEQVLSRTYRSNWVRIPVGTLLGLALNIAAPHLIHVFTKKVDKIEDYPGEMGLRELKKTKTGKQDPNASLFARMAPYLSQNLDQHNIWPALLSFAPLPLILGLFDTDKLATHGFRAAFNKPGKGYFKRFASILQYSKRMPFAGSQQMAILYAIVLAARMGSARNVVEFRERAVDGFLAWSIWILATPWMKKAVGRYMDRAHQTDMTKKVGGATLLKTEAEIRRLAKSPEVLSKTLNKFFMIGPASILTTILLLGIAEPYLSIRLTEWQSRWMQKRQQRKNAKQSVAIQTPTPAPAPMLQSGGRAQSHMSTPPKPVYRAQPQSFPVQWQAPVKPFPVPSLYPSFQPSLSSPASNPFSAWSYPEAYPVSRQG